MPFGGRHSLLGRPVPLGHRLNLTTNLLLMADPIGVSTFRIGKLRWASWPLYAGSRAPAQQGRKPLLTITPTRTCQPLSSPLALRRFDQGFTCVQLVPTSPGIDFSCGCLLSFCVYCLLETRRLPTTPRQYGDGPSVLAQPGIGSFQTQTLDLCDLVSHLRLANKKRPARSRVDRRRVTIASTFPTAPLRTTHARFRST